MSKYSSLVKRLSNATAATALTLASLTPAVMLGGTAKAGQVTNRSILIENSAASLTSTAYTVSFDAVSNARYLAIEFCSNSPILGAACTDSNISFASASVASGTLTKAGNVMVLDTGSALGIQGSSSFTVQISGVSNPSLGTFYARMATFTSDPNGATWDSSAPGSFVDYGGVALSTTNDVTINARVQEQLTFCAGSVVTDASAVALCGDIDGDTVDLGVVGTSTVKSPATLASTGNNRTGALLVFTNAINGVIVTYDSPSSLKTAGHSGACNEGVTSYIDQCFNTASGNIDNEAFGMTVKDIYQNGDTTSLFAATGYDGWNASALLSTHKWSTMGDTVVSSATSTDKVVDSEVVELEFAARAKATTPTGSYTTSANFVATATF